MAPPRAWPPWVKRPYGVTWRDASDPMDLRPGRRPWPTKSRAAWMQETDLGLGMTRKGGWFCYDKKRHSLEDGIFCIYFHRNIGIFHKTF